MEFAIGFAAGSAVTFIVLAVYGYKGMSDQANNLEREMQKREEQMYQAGYVNGYAKGQQDTLTIDTLPMTKN